MSRNSRAQGQDTKTTSIFEVVGAYFCDTFFNHIYCSARSKLRAGGSLTDEYIRLVKTYLLGTKTDKECYANVVRGVHTYFTATTRYTTLGFSEFVDRIVGVCIPPEYFEKFTTSDKDEILGSIICDLVSNLAAHVTTPDMLRRIIDGHAVSPDVTIRLMQDQAVTILSEKRLMLHNKFLSKAGQAREFVSIAQVEDMKKAMRRLVKEKAEALARIEELEEAIKAQRRATKAREAKMIKLISLLRTERLSGPAAVAARLKVPREDRIAERDPFADIEESVPDQERIAEARDSSESSDSDEPDESETDSSSDSDGPEAPRRAKGPPPKRAPAPKKGTAPRRAPASGLADFFGGAPVESAPARPSASKPPPASKPPVVVSAEGPLERVEAAGAPGLLESLLNGSGLLEDY